MVIKGFTTTGENVRNAENAFMPFRALASLLLLSLTGGCRVR